MFALHFDLRVPSVDVYLLFSSPLLLLLLHEFDICDFYKVLYQFICHTKFRTQLGMVRSDALDLDLLRIAPSHP